MLLHLLLKDKLTDFFCLVNNMLIAYTRVSTQDQSLNLQIDALEKVRCSKIFTDVVSGPRPERKGLDEALSYIREGGTLVVWKLDRLGRSLSHLIGTVNNLKKERLALGVLPKALIPLRPGKAGLPCVRAVAEFVLDITQGRTRAGRKLPEPEADEAAGQKPRCETTQHCPVPLCRLKNLNSGDLPDAQDLQSHLVPVYRDWGKTLAGSEYY